MPTERPTDASLARSAALVVVGTILSGPVGMLLAAVHPQPPWRDAATFAAHFHPLQQVAFWFGLVLLGACVYFVARAAAIAGERHRPRALAALISVAAYAAMVGTNYTLQIAFVPELARAHDPALAYVTMANPGAAAWALEMFGYGALGVATWLVAPVMRPARFGRAVAALFVANGVVSIEGAIITGFSLSWVMSTAGLVSFAAWNVLFAVAMGLAAIAWRPRRLEVVAGRAQRLAGVGAQLAEDHR